MYSYHHHFHCLRKPRSDVKRWTVSNGDRWSAAMVERLIYHFLHTNTQTCKRVHVCMCGYIYIYIYLSHLSIGKSFRADECFLRSYNRVKYLRRLRRRRYLTDPRNSEQGTVNTVYVCAYGRASLNYFRLFLFNVANILRRIDV